MDSLPPKVGGAKIAELSAPNRRGKAMPLLPWFRRPQQSCCSTSARSISATGRSPAGLQNPPLFPPVPATPCHLLRQLVRNAMIARGAGGGVSSRRGESNERSIGPAGTHKILMYYWSLDLQANEKQTKWKGKKRTPPFPFVVNQRNDRS